LQRDEPIKATTSADGRMRKTENKVQGESVNINSQKMLEQKKSEFIDKTLNQNKSLEGENN